MKKLAIAMMLGVSALTASSPSKLQSTDSLPSARCKNTMIQNVCATHS